MTILGEKKNYLEYKVQKMTILGEKKINRRLRDFHKSEEVNILGKKEKKKYLERKGQKMTILGQKKKKKKPGVEGPKNDHFWPK